MRRAFLLPSAAFAFLSKQKTEGGFTAICGQLGDLQGTIQSEHDADAQNYEKAACECASQTETLAGTEGEIPKASKSLNNAAATIESQTARREKEEADKAANEKSRADSEKLEKEQAAEWAKELAQLEHAKGDATQAANALGDAKGFLGDHPELLTMVNEMLDEVNADHTKLSTSITDGKTKRENDSFANNENIDNRTTQIKDGEEAIQDALSKTQDAKVQMLTDEDSLKAFSATLEGVTKYCELQANDWDMMKAQRAADFGAFAKAKEILECGGGSFLQLRQTENTKKAAVRQLIQMGVMTGNKAIAGLKAVMDQKTGDPLKKVKQLIRKMITKVLNEQMEDQASMGACSLELSQCKQKRDFALGEVEQLKLDAEEYGQKVEEAKAQWKVEHATYEENFNFGSKLHEIAIPDSIRQFEQSKGNAHNNIDTLAKAVSALEDHFGTAASAAPRAGPEEITPETGITSDRKTGDYGTGHSNGIAVIAMIKSVLAEHKANYDKLQQNHREELKANRDNKRDFNSNALQAKLAAETLAAWAEKYTALFHKTVDELQSQMDVAALNGRCVQKIEPCGVQTDKRAKREKEIQGLKDAWKILNEDSAGGVIDQMPAEWNAL